MGLYFSTLFPGSSSTSVYDGYGYDVNGNKNDFTHSFMNSNINYLYGIEYKTHDCLLVPPFKNIQLTASRTQLSELKEKFDQL